MVAERSSKMLRILEEHETLTKGLYCRPLVFSCGYDDAYQDMNCYGGVINNFKWLLVEEQLGDYWLDGTHTIEEFHNGEIWFEFVEGNIPKTHTITKKEISKYHH